MIENPHKRLEKFYEHLSKKIDKGEMSGLDRLEVGILELYATWEEIENEKENEKEIQK